MGTYQFLVVFHLEMIFVELIELVSKKKKQNKLEKKRTKSKSFIIFVFGLEFLLLLF